MKLIDYACVPGSAFGGGIKRGAGDDRYAFDEAAGWAAVIDGATDVGQIRLYPRAESDAAHFADLFARALIDMPADANESLEAYFVRLAQRLRELAGKDASVPLDQAPRDSLPTAACTWIGLRRGRIEAATLGDTLAIVRQPDGAVSVMGDNGKPADEQMRARRVMAMSKEERAKWLQDVRAVHNTQSGYWVFGVQPEAAGRIIRQELPYASGARALLVTDGFYRLVSPYGRYDDAALIAAAEASGLGPLISELRELEADAGEDAKIGRFKTSDDATALLVEF